MAAPDHTREAAAAPDVTPAHDAASAKKPAEPLTEDLLEQLLAAATPEAYLDAREPGLADRELADYLAELMAARGLRRTEVIRASGVNPTFAYQVFQGTRRPGRDNALMLAFGLRCDLREAQRLLRLAGAAELWCKDRRDAILIWCLGHGLTRTQADDELFRLGEPTMLPAKGE